MTVGRLASRLVPVVHHALLGLSVVALAVAGLRVASPLAERGLARLLAAAVVAVAAAVEEAILLGLVSLGGSTIALSLAALATGAGALILLPRPAIPLATEAIEAWRSRTPLERAGLGAIAGAGLAWAAWQLRHPGLGFDTIHYHLPEMAIFVQGGQPGSVHDVLPGLPVGNYPLTTEVTIAWAMGIARSLVPVVLWSWLTLTLTAASSWAGLRALGASPLTAGLAAAALCTNPWLLAWQSNGSVTDPPALAWLVTCAALTVLSRERPALLAVAIVAGGLAIGCKTTVMPFTLAVLVIGLWLHRERLRALVRPLAFATCAALLVGGVWYLRNLFTHGSPFWPIVATPWGDDVPASVRAVHTSFLDRPRATMDLLGHSYIDRFGGGILLLAAGLLAPLVAWRRRVIIGAAAVGAGLLIWARSPVTGIAPAATLPETVFSTTRYALPVVAAACLALALAATDRRSKLRLAALLALAGATVVNLVETTRLGYPVAPSALTPLAGAAVGAVAGFGSSWLMGRSVVPSRVRDWLAPALVVGACAVLAVPAGGFVRRHGETGSSALALAVTWLANDPQYSSGDAPLATTPAFVGPLAGDRLQHRLEAITAHESCATVAARARSQWLVVFGGPLGGKAPEQVKRCLGGSAFDNGMVAIYRPR
jgi:hypothetical protein